MRFLIVPFLLSNILFAQELEFEIGDIAPNFQATDQNDELINLETILEEQGVVLAFYRGAWCPYCKKHMSDFQDSVSLIEDKGYKVIAVTPEMSASRDKMVDDVKVSFSILSDNKYEIMQAYNTSYELSKETVPKYFNIVVNKTRSANGNEDDILPVPATFVINKDGIIKYIHYDKDYKERATISEILKHL